MEEGTIIAAQILDGYYFYRVPVNADGCTVRGLVGIFYFFTNHFPIRQLCSVIKA